MVFITHDLAEALKLGDHVMIMRGGKIVQIGKPEELVARPADDYVADFVRDIPKSHVLTLRWVMRAPTADDPVDGPVFGPDTVIRTAVRAVVESDKPIRVVEDGTLLGVVDRAQILEAVAGDEFHGGSGTTDGRSGPPMARGRVGAVDDVFDGAATLLADSAVNPVPPAPDR
jgi:glycine betaine/proline transport system ATP-binding protein